MSCTSCDGWGVVAPSAFKGDDEPWPRFLARAVEVARAAGFPPLAPSLLGDEGDPISGVLTGTSSYPPAASAALAGLIRPVPCPSCGGRRTRPGVMPFLQPHDADGHACGIDRAVGFVLVTPAPVDPAEAAEVLAVQAPAETQIAAADPPPVAPDGWCLGYVCRYTGHACFQSITGVSDRILRSTCQPIQIHAWPTREEALAWMASKGLVEGAFAPVGHEFLVNTLIPFERDWHRERPEWFDQVLFEFGKPAPPPVPTAGDDALAEALGPVPGDRTHARGGPKRSKRELARSVGASLFGDDA